MTPDDRAKWAELLNTAAWEWYQDWLRQREVPLAETVYFTDGGVFRADGTEVKYHPLSTQSFKVPPDEPWPVPPEQQEADRLSVDWLIASTGHPRPH